MSVAGIKFGDFELYPGRYELRRAGRTLKLERIPKELLILLVARNGNLVSREEIVERLWGNDVFVDSEHGINTAIRKIRHTLRDDPDQPRFVQTVTGKGYRFIAPVVEIGAAPAISTRPPSAVDAPKSIASNRGIVSSAAAILVLGLAATAWWFFSRNTYALTEKDTIVIADFTNKTGDAIFDDTLKQALGTVLGQSPFFNILPDKKVSDTLRLMERSPDEHINLDAAREICQRTGSTVVLAGSIASMGSQYVIGLNAMNCSSGDSLASEEGQASRKEEVLNALGKAAMSLRERLGESRLNP